MRSRFAWIAGLGLAAAAAVRAFRRSRPAPLEESVPGTDERAEALRRKLEESRSLVEERDEFEGAETTVDAAEPLADDPDERRRLVHGEARAAVDEMRRPETDR